MKFFKHLLLTLLFLSCNMNSGDEEEEFYFYEPVIGEAYNVVSDLDYKVEFDYQIQKDLVVETEDSRGFKYTLEIPSFALTPGTITNFDGYIIPLTGIQNLPAGIEFLFGVEIEPFGIIFSKPVIITVELPANFDTEDLRGFYNQGDWGSAYLEPIKIRRSTEKIEAIFNVTHFSSYGAMRAGDAYFDCPDPRSAQSCGDLKEVIACILGHYETGFTDELTGEDKKTINNILRSYMERQLQYLEEDPPDYFNFLDFQDDLSDFLCWAAITQEFNGNPESIFGDLYEKAAYYAKMVFAENASELENTCIQNRTESECVHGTVWYTIQTYVQLLEIAQYLGIDQELSMNDVYEFCDGAVDEVLFTLSMIDPVTLNEHYHSSGAGSWFKNYQLELSNPDDSIQFMYRMENALGQSVEVEQVEIEWIEENSSWYNENAFIYENGILKLDKNQQYVAEAIGCNPEIEVCSINSFHVTYSIIRNNCQIAYLSITWNNY